MLLPNIEYIIDIRSYPSHVGTWLTSNKIRPRQIDQNCQIQATKIEYTKSC